MKKTIESLGLCPQIKQQISSFTSYKGSLSNVFLCLWCVRRLNDSDKKQNECGKILILLVHKSFIQLLITFLVAKLFKCSLCREKYNKSSTSSTFSSFVLLFFVCVCCEITLRCCIIILCVHVLFSVALYLTRGTMQHKEQVS